MRFIGVTGHGMRIARHLASLERFPFDSVLLPYNHLVARPGLRGRRPDAAGAMCRAAGRRADHQVDRPSRWPDNATEPHFGWYQPLRDDAAIGRAVRFVLSDPQLFLNSSSDATLLPATVERRPAHSIGRGDELLADAERFDITPLFDGDALERI